MDAEKTKESGSSADDGKANGTPTPAEEHHADAPPKPSLLKRFQTKTGLDTITIILMIRQSLPPILALACYQATSFAKVYTTLGYLAAIMSLLALALQPRAKFLQAMFFSLLFTCLGAAMALLEIQCAVAARQLQDPPNKMTHTGGSGSKQSLGYSSSASVVAAVWLFFTLWLINTIRAMRPQLILPCIQYSIFTIVASIYAPNFPDMDAGESFVRRMLIAFLTGFAFATGVSLFVFPLTSRAVAGKQFAGMLGLMKVGIMSQGSYIAAITESHGHRKEGETEEKASAGLNQKAAAMKGNIAALGGLFAKLKLEIDFAKKEFGYGKLQPNDFSDLFVRIQQIMLPIVGMSTFMDIMNTIKEKKKVHERTIDDDEAVKAIQDLEAEEWDEVFAMSRDRYEMIKATLADGLTHIGLVLELLPKPKKKPGDIEKTASQDPRPGSPQFTEHLKKVMNEFHEHRMSIIHRWCSTKGIDLPDKFFHDPESHISLKDVKSKDSIRHKHNQQQLYLILYLGHLSKSMGQAILEGARYADSKVADGTMTKKKLISPGLRRVRKLITDIFHNKDAERVMTDSEDAGTNIYVGDSLKAKKDPEHLPPANLWEKATNYLRSIPRFLASAESAYGFRAATAAISIGILAYIRQTHNFFLEQRGFWALIMTGISMDTHAGRGVFGFLARIFGTIVAMAVSIAIWYIGYKHAAAIIPIFFIYLMGCVWFLLKNPTLTIVAIISMVTVVLIVGYELQDEKIGRKITTSNGQAYYEIYLLAPYRLVSVIAGLAVAFVWTYFPYPITTHGTLRKDLGQTLYLMANYYSCVHTTVDARLSNGAKLDDFTKGTPMYKLAKARREVFSKIIIMLDKLREHSRFTKWEPTFGGKFPKATYDDLILSLQHIFNYTSLIVYSTRAFITEPDAEESRWLQDFRSFTRDLKITSHDMTSTLCLVSASIADAKPLPPYLRIPEPFMLSEKLSSVDPEILSVQHIDEPCYAAFAVLEVASSLITEEMAHVVKIAQSLVGEVDFSFHIISTSDSSSLGSTIWGEETEEKAKKA